MLDIGCHYDDALHFDKHHRIGGRDPYRRYALLKSLALEKFEQKHVRQGDAVKILDRCHEFCGFTGRVLYIDTRDPGQEVAEVRASYSAGISSIPVVTNCRNCLKILSVWRTLF